MGPAGQLWGPHVIPVLTSLFFLLCHLLLAPPPGSPNLCTAPPASAGRPPLCHVTPAAVTHPYAVPSAVACLHAAPSTSFQERSQQLQLPASASPAPHPIFSCCHQTKQQLAIISLHRSLAPLQASALPQIQST